MAKNPVFLCCILLYLTVRRVSHWPEINFPPFFLFPLYTLSRLVHSAFVAPQTSSTCLIPYCCASTSIQLTPLIYWLTEHLIRHHCRSFNCLPSTVYIYTVLCLLDFCVTTGLTKVLYLCYGFGTVLVQDWHNSPQYGLKLVIHGTST